MHGKFKNLNMSLFLNLLFLLSFLVLLYHIFYGLPALIVTPIYFLFIFIFVLISTTIYGQIRIKYVYLILGLWLLALLNYVLIPSDVVDKMPDANYIEQLIKIYTEHNRILTGVGTNEAFDYSYYPLLETFVIVLSRASGISVTTESLAF